MPTGATLPYYDNCLTHLSLLLPPRSCECFTQLSLLLGSGKQCVHRGGGFLALTYACARTHAPCAGEGHVGTASSHHNLGHALMMRGELMMRAEHRPTVPSADAATDAESGACGGRSQEGGGASGGDGIGGHGEVDGRDLSSLSRDATISMACRHLQLASPRLCASSVAVSGVMCLFFIRPSIRMFL